MRPNRKDGGAAFPREDYQDDTERGQSGMSLRDYFAGQALAGILAGPMAPHLHSVAEEHGVESSTILAQSAYEYADEMLKVGKA